MTAQKLQTYFTLTQAYTAANKHAAQNVILVQLSFAASEDAFSFYKGGLYLKPTKL